MTFFRYPGGKSKLRKIIIEKLKKYKNVDEYREPFFGGGGIGIYFLNSVDYIKKVWINEKDTALLYLWRSVVEKPNELKKLIKKFQPGIEHFYSFKQELQKINSDNIIEIGFKKLVLHQLSFSGLGIKSGGPLGGKKQESKYKVDCRWSPNHLCNKIDRLNFLLNKFEIKFTNDDFSEVLKNTSSSSLTYLDPPYYVKGNELYQYGFSQKDHIRLSNILKTYTKPWLLSYDDCEKIRSFYNWANIYNLSVNYTINTKTGSRQKNEVLICK